MRTKFLNCKKPSLAETHPEIAAQWHPIKNGTLTPHDITHGSGKRIWWRCEDGHEWEAKIYSRTLLNAGCPYCGGKKVDISNCLATTNPLVAALWHPNNNGSLTPNDVVRNSGKKVWWQCPKGDDHEWEARVAQVVIAFKRNSPLRGCPVCRGLKVVLSNSLAGVYPTLAQELHPRNNGLLLSTNIHAGSHQKVWWQCPKNRDHIWQASVKQRASAGNGCPMCRGSIIVPSNALATMNPTLAREFHPHKNGSLLPSDIHMGSHKKVWWLCSKNNSHEWRASVDNRRNGSGCPACCCETLNSRAVRRIETWLNNNRIVFVREKTFLDLKSLKRSRNRLRFDFFIPSHHILIEFDGEQHFKPVPYFGGEKGFHNLVANDHRKNMWTKNNGYQLIRISFKDEDRIEEILTYLLEQHK